MKIHKYTNGYVKQTFDSDGNLISQEFDCNGGEVRYTCSNVEGIEEESSVSDFSFLKEFYHSFDMEQPPNYGRCGDCNRKAQYECCRHCPYCSEREV